MVANSVKSVEQTVLTAPGNPDVLVAYARVLTTDGQYGRALAIMDEAYRLNPKPPPHYALNEAWIQFYLGNYTKAVEIANLVKKQVPNSHFASWVLAPALALLGKSAEAKAELELLVERIPNLSLAAGLDPPVPVRLKWDRGRLSDGLRLAGAPVLEGGAKPPGEQLTNEEIQTLFSDRTITGRDFANGALWSHSQDSEGNARSWDSDENQATGAFSVEDGWACWAWDVDDQYKRCSQIFLNPNGSSAGLDRYILAGTGCGLHLTPDPLYDQSSGGICPFAIAEPATE